MNKAVGYCRVSTPDQVERISLQDQEKQIKAYCKQNDLELICVYIEKGVSGKNDNRPQYRKMLAEAANGDFDIVVVLDISRFGRNLQDRIRIRNVLVTDFGIQLHSIKEGVFQDDPTGRLQDNLLAGVAEWQRDVLLERSQSAIELKLSDRGERNLGHLLYGLTWATDKKSAIHHPDEYPLLRLVIELRLKLKWSYVMIADFLNGKLQDTKGLKIAKKLKIPIPSVYRGNVSWDRYKVGYICSLNTEKYCAGESTVTFRGQVYKYEFPRLITSAELTGLKKAIPAYVQGHPKKHYLLSGKVICGLCGGKLHHNIIRTKYKGNLRVYKYYTCINQMTVKNGHRCTLPSIRQSWLEEEVWNQLAYLFSSQSHFESVLFRANDKLAKGNEKLSEIADEIVSIDKAIQDIDKQLENLVNFIATGDITGGVAGKKIAELTKSKNKLLKQQKDLDIAQSILIKEETTIKKLESTRLWWASYSHTMQEQDKQKIVDALIDEVRVYPLKQKCKDHPAPEDSRTPALVHIEVKGQIPITESELFGLSKVGVSKAAALYRDSSSSCR